MIKNKRWMLFAAPVLAGALTMGCATLDEQQRAWIFQPSDDSWGGSALLARGMQDVWIPFESQVSGQSVQLHGLWLAADHPRPGKPVLLYLHGARWNVASSAGRIRRLQEMGFSVLAIDYRGFGKSSHTLPSEDMAYEDAGAAWGWLAAKYPGRPRYIFGHSLGGAIAIDLAARVNDEAGVMVESTFTSIADVASTFRWGWLPFTPLLTQRFESVAKVGRIGSPLLVVHGTEDHLIPSSLGRRLFEAARGRKELLLVDGATHHSSMTLGQSMYRRAIDELFQPS